MRNKAREAVYKLLFSNQFNDKFDDNLKLLIYSEEGLSDKAIEFADSLLDSFYANEDSINAIISDLAKGYNFERIYSMDKCALQIAVTEMTYIKDIPHIVSISEAMELVRKYSTKESPNFVNGILAEYKKQLEN
ncbi:MAG: transcription antitermination factor NusB [Clostridia bacterium]|jgi:N utilization substance protein B|nr:transcription antitermination factor NusB [Clostridia bacterium]